MSEVPPNTVIGTPEVPHQYVAVVEGGASPGRYVRVVGGVVAEGPVDLPDAPVLFFGSGLEGEWIEIANDEKVCCHWVRQEDGSFAEPPTVQPPLVINPTDQLAALLWDNPTLIDELQQLAAAPVVEASVQAKPKERSK